MTRAGLARGAAAVLVALAPLPARGAPAASLPAPASAGCALPEGPAPEARALVEAAIAEAKAREEAGRGSRRYRVRTTVEKLDGDDRVKERESSLHEVEPIDGHPYLRRLERDGRPLERRELEKERRRERDFRERIARGESPDGREEPDDGEAIELDSELLDRYRGTVRGAECVAGKAAWVVEFEPVSGELPVRRRMDRALNRTRGRLWVDVETRGIARLEFELTEAVKLLFGIVASISEVRGSYLQRPGADPAEWLPHRFDLYLDGRVGFRSLHQRIAVDWSELTGPAPAASASPR